MCDLPCCVPSSSVPPDGQSAHLLWSREQPDIKVLQIQLTGFLDKDTPKFCKELWNLCLSAQENPQGVPKELLEAKKLELIQEKVGPLPPRCPDTVDPIEGDVRLTRRIS